MCIISNRWRREIRGEGTPGQQNSMSKGMEKQRCRANRKIDKGCIKIWPEDQITPRSNSLGEKKKELRFQPQIFIEHLVCATVSCL